MGPGEPRGLVQSKRALLRLQGRAQAQAPLWLPQAAGQAAGRPPSESQGCRWPQALLLRVGSQAATQAAQSLQYPSQPGWMIIVGCHWIYTGTRGTGRPSGARLRWPKLNPGLTRGRHGEPASGGTSPSSFSLFHVFTELEKAHSVLLSRILPKGLGTDVVFAAVLQEDFVTVVFPG